MTGRVGVVALALLAAVTAPARADDAAEKALERALVAVHSSQFVAALDDFEQALRRDPGNLRYASEYRQAVIQAEAYDRCLAFFEQLTAEHPGVSSAFLNYGFAYIDKMPTVGSITQVILANASQQHFTKALELEGSWLGFYTRGNSYLFWPKVFERAQLGVADLEAAFQIQKDEDRKDSRHARVYVSLGDGYWKTDQIDKARALWKEGLREFPDHQGLQERLSREGDELKAYIDEQLDPSQRVDTDLREMWRGEGRENP